MHRNSICSILIGLSLLALALTAFVTTVDALPPDKLTVTTYFATSACIDKVGLRVRGCNDDSDWGQVTPYFTVHVTDCPIGVGDGD